MLAGERPGVPGLCARRVACGSTSLRRADKLSGPARSQRTLPRRLREILPANVTCNELLMNFCSRLIAADPAQRFPTADDANLQSEGAAGFHRQLVKSDLAGEYESEIRLWVQEVQEVLADVAYNAEGRSVGPAVRPPSTKERNPLPLQPTPEVPAIIEESRAAYPPRFTGVAADLLRPLGGVSGTRAAGDPQLQDPARSGVPATRACAGYFSGLPDRAGAPDANRMDSRRVSQP